jgi:adenosylcobyric acid synthase
MGDLKWLRASGLEAAILKLAADKVPVMGICGGYQMLGQTLSDPDGVEEGGELRGMGLLPIHTVFDLQKVRTQVHGKTGKLQGIWRGLSDVAFEGYEIHMGRTTLEKNALPFSGICLTNEADTQTASMSADGCQFGNVCGTYVHGIFDTASMQQAVVKMLLEARGLSSSAVTVMDENIYRQQQYDKLADGLRESLDMAAIYRILEEGLA